MSKDVKEGGVFGASVVEEWYRSVKHALRDSQRVKYILYVVLFTSMWFAADPAYTLLARMGFKAQQHSFATPLVPLLVVVWWQMLACSLLCLCVSSPFVVSNWADFREALLPSRATAMMMLLNVGAQSMQMAALGFGTLSLSQVVRAVEPVFLLFWFKVSRTPVNAIMYVSTIPIYLGAIITAGTAHHFSWISLFAGLLSNLLLTGRNFFLKLALSSEEKEVPASTLLFQTSLWPAIGSGFALFFVGFFLDTTDATTDYYLQLSGVLFAVMRISSLLMLKEFSLLVHSLLKLSRRVVVIAMGFMIWNSHVNSWHVAGICMTVLGAACAEMTKRYESWKFLGAAFFVVFLLSALSFVVSGHVMSYPAAHVAAHAAKNV